MANNEESQHQKSLVGLARLMPGIKDTIYAVPNGAHLAGSVKQKAIQMDRLKAEGLRTGVSDLVIAEPILFRELFSGESLGLYLEMKREKGGKVSAEQQKWCETVTSRGYEFAVANGVDEGIGILQDYAERIRAAKRLRISPSMHATDDVIYFILNYMNDNPDSTGPIKALLDSWIKRCTSGI